MNIVNLGSTSFSRLKQYAVLMRLNKPIGILLLLWPTLWALWLASQGKPHTANLIIFILGVIIMRSAGCIINDIADRNIDRHVERTSQRPLVTGAVSIREALVLFTALCLAACALVLFCNRLTMILAGVGLLLAMLYPFLKRITHLPQIGLGLAFSWGIPMAFAAETNTVPFAGWMLFITGVLWPIIYDTFYAMADRAEDKKIGVKSTAILFGQADLFILGMLQIMFIVLLLWMGMLFQLTPIYFLTLPVVFTLFLYHLYLAKDREPRKCFNVFLNSNWVGMVVFIGILLGTSS